MKKIRPLMVFTLTLLLAASSNIALCGPAYASTSEMTLYSIYTTVNPGQTPEKGKEKEFGDSVLLESEGEYLLMDCGAPFVSKSVINYVKSVMPAGTKLDVYISHLHRDHYGGFYDLARQVNIGTVYLPDKDTIGTEFKSTGTDADIETILDLNFYNSVSTDQIVWLKQGSEFTVGSVSAFVLGPAGQHSMDDFVTNKYGKQESHYLNNWSLSTMFTTASGVRFFTGGDIEEPEENALINVYGKALKADIMKLSHHALRTSNTEAFIAKVRPTFAFAENMGYTEPVISEKGNVAQRFHASAKNIRPYGLFYIVGSEKASLGIRVDGGRIRLFRDSDNNGSLTEEEMLSGWTSVAGISAVSQTDYTGKNNYYLDPKTGLPYTGVRYIDGTAYLFGSGGSLQKAFYDETGYTYFRLYGEKLRYFSDPDENGIAGMNVGIQQVGSKYYYFDTGTGCRFTAKKGTGGSKKWKLVKIGKYKYAVNINNGKVFNYMTEKKASLKLGTKKYTFDTNGKLLKITKIKKTKKSKKK